MKIGYFLDFHLNLLEEIKFAKENFDFIEITFDYGIKVNNEEIEKASKLLEDFLVIGHFNWNLEPEKDYKEIENSIKIFKKFKAKYMVIHPKNYLSSEENISFLNSLKNKTILIENMSETYGKSEAIKQLLEKTKLNLCLDIGHAGKTNELENFLKLIDKIKHIHLHYNIDKKDHLFFTDESKLKEILFKIKELNATVSLEMFKDTEKILNPEERKRLLLIEKNKIRKLLQRL